MKPSVTKLHCPLNSPRNRLSLRESQFADDAFFLTSLVMWMVGYENNHTPVLLFQSLGRLEPHNYLPLTYLESVFATNELFT